MAITGQDFGIEFTDWLNRMGVDTSMDITRVVIDVPCDDLVKIHVEYHGDKRILVDLPYQEGIEISTVN